MNYAALSPTMWSYNGSVTQMAYVNPSFAGITLDAPGLGIEQMLHGF